MSSDLEEDFRRYLADPRVPRVEDAAETAPRHIDNRQTLTRVQSRSKEVRAADDVDQDFHSGILRRTSVHLIGSFAAASARSFQFVLPRWDSAQAGSGKRRISEISSACARSRESASLERDSARPATRARACMTVYRIRPIFGLTPERC